MNQRENLLSLLQRKGFEKIPVEFILCPSLVEEYQKQTGSSLPYAEYFNMPWESIPALEATKDETDHFRKFYPFELKPNTHINCWGVAFEPGSIYAKHMSHMRHPLAQATTLEEMKNYPYPAFIKGPTALQKSKVEKIHAKNLAAVGNMQCTIWETAWYIRSMEELMMDMLSDDPKAEFLLDKITETAIMMAESYAKAGVDILFLGDDIGMQKTTLMSEPLYVDWIKPRLKKVIAAAKSINKDIVIFYHSCGLATPFIPHLIETGIDVLNPVQPECMNFEEIYNEYGDVLSFHGTIGTQTTMPFQSPEEVRKAVLKNLHLSGARGGLFVAPTHVLEPEVPWENIMAYVKACEDFTR